MAEPSTPEPPDIARLVGVKLGNYRLERLLGRGRMGVVYLARDEALLRPTAVKVLWWALEEVQHHDPVQWFLAEARLVARINHPRVVQIYAVARHGDHRYIAMEYIDGQSAEALIGAHGPLPERRALEVVQHAAQALQAAHASGVVHRDVKPANLLVGPGGIAKLTDFGMALSLSDDRTGFTGLRVGTPYYTAPELWQGAEASFASDIYALGATGYCLLTGRPPFRGQDVSEVQYAHLHAPLPDPRREVPALSEACARLVQRAIARQPERRFESAQALEAALSQVLAEAGGPRPRRSTDRPASSAAAVDALGAGAASAVVIDRRAVSEQLWRRAASGRRGGPALLVSPDAVLLIEHRAQQRRERLDVLADNAALLGSLAARRVITSWEAYAAPSGVRLTRQQAAAEEFRRPAGWPLPEARALLDELRGRAGMRPWPRPPDRPADGLDLHEEPTRPGVVAGASPGALGEPDGAGEPLPAGRPPAARGPGGQ